MLDHLIRERKRLEAKILKCQERIAQLDVEIMGRAAAIAGGKYKDLSPRQKEVLHLVAARQVNKEIAAHLGITVRTVKFHMSSLFNRFNVKSRVDLIPFGKLAA